MGVTLTNNKPEREPRLELKENETQLMSISLHE